MTLRSIGLTIILMSLANGAFAQETPTVGVSMGYPASIGIVWQVTDGVALRPEVGATKSSTEFTATTTSSFNGTTTTTTQLVTTDSWQAAVGLSALFYLSRHDALRTYVSPRWAYTRSSSASTPVATVGTSGSTGNSHFVSGSFGVQYAIGRRFNVFGEVGLGYSRTVNSPNASPSNIFSTESTSWTVATRSGAGVVLYF